MALSPSYILKTIFLYWCNCLFICELHPDDCALPVPSHGTQFREQVFWVTTGINQQIQNYRRSHAKTLLIFIFPIWKIAWTKLCFALFKVFSYLPGTVGQFNHKLSDLNYLKNRIVRSYQLEKKQRQNVLLRTFSELNSRVQTKATDWDEIHTFLHLPLHSHI